MLRMYIYINPMCIYTYIYIYSLYTCIKIYDKSKVCDAQPPSWAINYEASSSTNLKASDNDKVEKNRFSITQPSGKLT